MGFNSFPEPQYCDVVQSLIKLLPWWIIILDMDVTMVRSLGVRGRFQGMQSWRPTFLDKLGSEHLQLQLIQLDPLDYKMETPN
jgi:hypothetical protein